MVPQKYYYLYSKVCCFFFLENTNKSNECNYGKSRVIKYIKYNYTHINNFLQNEKYQS